MPAISKPDVVAVPFMGPSTSIPNAPGAQRWAALQPWGHHFLVGWGHHFLGPWGPIFRARTGPQTATLKGLCHKSPSPPPPLGKGVRTPRIKPFFPSPRLISKLAHHKHPLGTHAAVVPRNGQLGPSTKCNRSRVYCTKLRKRQQTMHTTRPQVFSQSTPAPMSTTQATAHTSRPNQTTTPFLSPAQPAPLSPKPPAKPSHPHFPPPPPYPPPPLVPRSDCVQCRHNETSPGRKGGNHPAFMQASYPW